ncbi:hypothetical protein WA158_004046 [Blastocystis sp. Blastoise]
MGINENHTWFCFKNLSSKKYNMINTVHIGIGFTLLFFGFNSGQNFAVKLFGNLGSISLAILYCSYSFCNLLAPSIISVLKSPRLAVALGACIYTIYILQFVYVIPWFIYIYSIIQGLGSGLLWAAQGIYINDCSTEDDRGQKAGLFWALFMMSNVLGNLACFFIIRVFPIEGVAHDGWNDNCSLLFLILGSISILGCLLLFILRKPYNVGEAIQSRLLDKEKAAETSLNASENATTLSGEVKEVEEGFIQRLKCMFETLKDVKMWLLLPLIFSSGYSAVFIASHYSRQIVNTELIGICMCIYGIVEVIFSYIMGYVSDHWGNTVCIVTGVVCQLISLIVSVFADSEQNWLIYVPAVFFGIADCSFNTQLMTLCGQLFSKYVDASFAALRMFQSLGSTLCFFLAPLFVSAGAVIATHDNYIIEVIVSGVICIFGFLFYLILACKYGTNWNPAKIDDNKRIMRASSSFNTIPINNVL